MLTEQRGKNHRTRKKHFKKFSSTRVKVLRDLERGHSLLNLIESTDRSPAEL